MRVLVDADSIVYMAGFATQSNDYRVVVRKTDGDVVAADVYDDKDDAEAAVAAMPEDAGLVADIEPIVDAESLVNTLATVKRSILKIEEDLRCEHGLHFDKLELVLTGKGNWRTKYAIVAPYKGNRTAAKPVHYEAMRAYMVNRWGAHVVDGMEADDYVAYVAHTHHYSPDEVCIASCDKDLKTVPGRLYNFKRRTMEIITPHEALRNFYRQMITGDAVDNIPGCYKAGPKAAETAIPDGLEDEQLMWNATVALFEKSLGIKGCPYAARSGGDVALEMGRLLHMQRYMGDIWNPPPRTGSYTP